VLLLLHSLAANVRALTSQNTFLSRVRTKHQDIPVPEVDPGANSWEKGPAYQIELKQATGSNASL
jgi:hypothetical protein